MATDQLVPNPGSVEAHKQGCTCATMDNNYGRFPPFPAMNGEPEGWWITEGCPLHAPKKGG